MPDNGNAREKIEILMCDRAKVFLEAGKAFVAKEILDIWNQIDDILQGEER